MREKMEMWKRRSGEENGFRLETEISGVDLEKRVEALSDRVPISQSDLRSGNVRRPASIYEPCSHDRQVIL